VHEYVESNDDYDSFVHEFDESIDD